MERSTVSPRVYRFGPFELSPDAAELRKNGLRLKLQEQPFQVLCTLLDHPGEIVTRDQLRQQLWPDGTFVDFEHGLNTAIKKLRDVLSDDADTPRYIETIPRKGYRFIALRNGDNAAGTQPPVTQPISPGPTRRRFLFAIGGVIVIAVAVLLITVLGRGPAGPRVTSITQLTFTGDIWPGNIQTDGRRLFYVKMTQDRIFSIPVGGGEEASFATRFHPPAVLHISPDGSTLLVMESVRPSESQLWLVPTNGAPARPLADIAATAAAWSPDGKAIAFAKGNAIYLTTEEGSPYRKLCEFPGISDLIRWSPDGRMLRFNVIDPKTNEHSIWEERPGQTARRYLPGFKTPGAFLNGDWTRDGRYFLVRKLSNGRWEYWYVEETRWSLRAREPVLLAAGMKGEAAVASPLENRIFLIGNEDSTAISKFDPRSGKTESLFPGTIAAYPAFSPDGKSVVITRVHNPESVLWRARVDGSEWLQLTDPKMYVYGPIYSPDGKRLALMGKLADQPWKIYLISSEGGAVQQLNAPVESQADPNWTPDGESIIFGEPPRIWAEPEGPRWIYELNLKTNSLAKLPNTEGWYGPRLSADGRQLLAVSVDLHRLGLYDLPSAQWRTLIDEPQHQLGSPFWSLDRGWAYVNFYDNLTLVRVRIRDGHRENVVACRDITEREWCTATTSAPDGGIMFTSFKHDDNLYALEYK